MREDAALLYIIEKMNKYNCLDGNYARALLSKILGKVIDMHEFEIIVTRLSERELIEYTGEIFNKINDKCNNPEEKEYILNFYLKQHEKEILNEALLSLSGKLKDERKSEIEHIYSGIRQKVPTIKQIDLDQYVSNCIKGHLDLDNLNFQLTRYPGNFWNNLSFKIDTTYAIKKITENLTDKFDQWFWIYSENEEIIVITIEDFDSPVRVYGSTAQKLDRKKNVDIFIFSNPEIIIKDLILFYITSAFKASNYTKTVKDNRFINYGSFKTIETEPINFVQFHGVRFQLDIIRMQQNEIDFLLWLDNSNRIVLPLSSCFNYYKDQYPYADVIEHLKELKVWLTPDNYYVSPVEIGEFIDIFKEQIPYKYKSYYDYYLWRYGWKLRMENQPLVLCQYKQGKPKPYPIETLFVHRQSYQKKLQTDFDVESAKPPGDRMKFVEEYANLLYEKLSTYENIISLNPKTLTWKELKDFGLCKKGYSYPKPNLLFSNNDVKSSTKPMEIHKYGPYSNSKRVYIQFALRCPDLNSRTLSEALVIICRQFRKSQFGILSFNHSCFYQYDPSSSEDEIRSVFNKIACSKGDFSIAIINLPKTPDPNYYLLKEIVTDYYDIPSQMLSSDTIRDIARGKKSITKKVCMQIYNKCLQRNESPWILEKHVDKKNETMYIGLGYSFMPYEPEKRASTFSSMCDSRGQYLNWNHYGIKVLEKRTIDERGFSELVSTVYSEIRDHRNIRRVVFYRNGDVYESEIKVMKQRFDQGVGDIRDFEFVFLNENHIYRIFKMDTDGYHNPTPGLAIELNNKEILLANSRLFGKGNENRSVIPVLVGKKISEKDIEFLTREYYYLSFLNWSDPKILSKDCLLLKIANKMAQMMKFLSSTKVLKFFPL